jgi:hypothetical protein
MQLALLENNFPLEICVYQYLLHCYVGVDDGKRTILIVVMWFILEKMTLQNF